MTIKRKKNRKKGKKGKKLKNKGTPGEKKSAFTGENFFVMRGVSSIWFLNALNLRRKKCTNKTKVPN